MKDYKYTQFPQDSCVSILTLMQSLFELDVSKLDLVIQSYIFSMTLLEF